MYWRILPGKHPYGFRQQFLWAVFAFACLRQKEKNFKNNFLRHPKTVPFILFPYLYFGIQTILQSLKNENMHD